MRGSKLDHLEELAEELIKENPEETVVRAHMKAAGLKYTVDSCERLQQTLTELDQARSQSRVQAGHSRKGKFHDKDL